MPYDVPPPQFRAVIVPHRSLSPIALRTLMLVIAAASGVTAALVVALGAWPVVGFTGLEMLLALVLLRHHAGGVRATEMLMLTEAGLTVVRIDRRGRRKESHVPAAWLSVELQDRPGRVPALVVCARGMQEEVGGCLGDAEKRDLAAALAAALHAARHRVFDNPQLRA